MFVVSQPFIAKISENQGKMIFIDDGIQYMLSNVLNII